MAPIGPHPPVSAIPAIPLRLRARSDLHATVWAAFLAASVDTIDHQHGRLAHPVGHFANLYARWYALG